MNGSLDPIQAICVGTVVAFFLLNTSRGLKALELCKECLLLLNSNAVDTGGIFAKLISLNLYFIMFEAHCLLNDYKSAMPYGRKLLALYREFGNKAKEGELSIYMGKFYEYEMEHTTAKKLYYKALNIMIEIGDRKGEATANVNLGIVFQFLAEYVKATEYHEKALAIAKETGNRHLEAMCYSHLGLACDSVGKYNKSKKLYEKAIAITVEIGDKQEEASGYANLAAVLFVRGEFHRAKEYHEKALSIRKEIGDRKGECSSYGNLGVIFQSLGEYIKAKEYHEKALAIRMKTGDKDGEGANYANLGVVFAALNEYDKAKECLEKALAIQKQIGDRNGEASVKSSLGMIFEETGEYVKAKEFLENSLAIRKDIGDRYGEGTAYRNLGMVFDSLGEYVRAKKYLDKSLAIAVEIGDRRGEAHCCGNLGVRLLKSGDHYKAEICLKRSLAILKDIRDIESEIRCLCNIAWCKCLQQKIEEACSYLSLSIKKCENLRRHLGDNDQFKASFFDNHGSPFWLLSTLFFVRRNPKEALYIVEQGRARALADLMTKQYSVEKEISVDPQSWDGIESVMKRERSTVCLYIMHFQLMYLWILKTSGLIHSQMINVFEYAVGDRLKKNFEAFLSDGFRMFGIRSEENCEDRSLNIIRAKGGAESAQILEEDEDKKETELSLLPLFYKTIIAPVIHLLEEPEILIVPDTCYYKVPFAALANENGKYLSETFRIRIVPSLMTLKLIQESPADYHCQDGALIVGDPEVGEVQYKKRIQSISPLPCARKEAEIIGRILDVQPLLGQHATKQAVLLRMNSVSLIHFAAHSNAEKGEIALAPVRPSNGYPQEEDYLLTMSDVSQVRLRAKLVVLSCCHSARGKISEEGVVGIARAFLGSGARSVLMALWALEDSATERFMSRFYEHLVRCESASESLHEAMKWMRDNGYSDARQWAPFTLMGDNVTFHFANKGI